jgi:hypothetical protein
MQFALAVATQLPSDVQHISYVKLAASQIVCGWCDMVIVCVCGSCTIDCAAVVSLWVGTPMFCITDKSAVAPAS